MCILESNRFKGAKVNTYYTRIHKTFKAHSPFKKPLVVSRLFFKKVKGIY